MFEHDGNMFFGGGFMWIFWLFLIFILFVAIKAIAGTGENKNTANRETPIEILKKRYANGEINEEEYERRRKELEL